jgi:hypothetical protein
MLIPPEQARIDVKKPARFPRGIPQCGLADAKIRQRFAGMGALRLGGAPDAFAQTDCRRSRKMR